MAAEEAPAPMEFTDDQKKEFRKVTRRAKARHLDATRFPAAG